MGDVLSTQPVWKSSFLATLKMGSLLLGGYGTGAAE